MFVQCSFLCPDFAVRSLETKKIKVTFKMRNDCTGDGIMQSETWDLAKTRLHLVKKNEVFSKESSVRIRHLR
jgi:hypothetical protein